MERNNKKLLLIMPPQTGLLNGFAAGLISLANFASVKLPEISTEILDLSMCSFNKAKQKIISTYSRFRNSKIFVGITCTTASYQSALRICAQVKDIDSQAITILGGHHASADPENILYNNSDVVDLIVVGEGEHSLCSLIKHYPALHLVPGIVYIKNKNLTINKSPNPLSTEELDSISISYKDNGMIGIPGKFDHVTYISARGCHLNCAFCAVGNNRIRSKSIGAIIRDIEILIEMGFNRISFEDNFFAHSHSRTKYICEALAYIKHKNDDFVWDCQTRVESLVRKNSISLMKKAGCEAVYIGVESFHPEHLLYLNKTKDPTKYLNLLIDNVVPRLLEANIKCYLNLQFGLTGVTIENEHKTFEVLSFLGKLASSKNKIITVFPQLHVIYPGTKHFKEGIEEGKFSSDVFETFTKWEFCQTPVLYWLGEYFAHGAGGIPEGILKPNLLKEGKYEVNSEAVFHISGALRSIDRISGVQTFHYGNHIVNNPSLAKENGFTDIMHNANLRGKEK